MPRHFSSDEGLFGEKGENENKSFKVISNAGTEDRNASNICWGCIYCHVNCCLCLSSIVKCVNVLCVASLF